MFYYSCEYKRLEVEWTNWRISKRGLWRKNIQTFIIPYSADLISRDRLQKLLRWLNFYATLGYTPWTSLFLTTSYEFMEKTFTPVQFFSEKVFTFNIRSAFRSRYNTSVILRQRPPHLEVTELDDYENVAIRRQNLGLPSHLIRAGHSRCLSPNGSNWTNLEIVQICTQDHAVRAKNREKMNNDDHEGNKGHNKTTQCHKEECCEWERSCLVTKLERSVEHND